MATTVKHLIEMLEKYYDPEETVIFQFFSAEDFENEQGTPLVTKEKFAEFALNYRGDWAEDNFRDDVESELIHFFNLK
jgi:hypothetical protein